MDCQKLNSNERLVELVTSHQQVLYTYIFSLVHRPDDAQEILQETNLVLWRKSQESLHADDFKSWACKIGYYQVLAHRKRRAREKLYFNDALLERLADEAALRAQQSNSYHESLRQCLEKLPQHSRKMLQMRYDSPGSVGAMAEELDRTAAAVSQALYRIRNVLLGCIKRALAMEGSS